LVVNDLMTARMLQFEHIIATELPLVADDVNLDADARDALDAYVVGLQDWVAGILDWHILTGRYGESELRHRYRKPPQRFGGPAGLGVSATVIGLLNDIKAPV
jgi:germacradienol/geosmin synthase